MKLLKIIGIGAGAAAAGVVVLAIMNPGNVAKTSAGATDGSFRPRRYKVDLQTFVTKTEKIIPALSTYGRNWKLAGGENGKPRGGAAVLLVEVPVVIFTDDLEINANYDAEKGETVVNVRSASRVGSSDFGENRRHILQLLRALDEKFGRES